MAEDEELKTGAGDSESFEGAEGYAKLDADDDKLDGAPLGVIKDPEEAHAAAMASHELVDEYADGVQYLERQTAIAALVDELRPQYQKLKLRTQSGSSDERVEAEKELDTLIDEATVRLQDLEGDNGTVNRQAVIEGLADNLDRDTYNSYGRRELTKRIANAEKNNNQSRNLANHRAELAQVLHRHPDAVDVNGEPLTVAGLIHLDSWHRGLNETVQIAEQDALAIEDPKFSENTIWTALNEAWHREQLTEADLDTIRELYKDNATTLGTIKEKAASLIRDGVSAERERLQQIIDILTPLSAELTKIRAKQG